jgi:probable rRNA maturation factor
VLFGALPTRSKFTAEEKRLLKQFARALADRVADGHSFTCVVTSDSELRKLNNKFLRRDYATDVLSFPALSSNGDLGEMAISAERADAQAREFNHSRFDEVRILMLHGLLHLTGLDHERDRGEMARAERRWRAELNLPATLIARVRRSGAKR